LVWEFKVKKKFSLVDKFLRVILKIAVKKPLFINLNENKELPPKCIIIGNHRSAVGPFTYRTHMPEVCMVAVAHQMCEKFKSRWNYLYYVFYQQKCKRSKLASFVLATVLGSISPVLYRFAGALPIYFDLRIAVTYKYCLRVLNENVPVTFFPENSDDGYFEIITQKFNMGYLKLAELYLRRYKEDIPIYTLHFASNPSRIVRGKPMYYGELAKTHTDEEINEIFREYMNSLNSVGRKESAPEPAGGAPGDAKN